VQPTPEQSHVTVTGSPANVSAEGMTITGGKLVLDRPDAKTNLMSVAGQGVLTMPVDRDLQGRPSATPDIMHLTWQGGLTFDGTVAVFERGVEAILSTQYLRTDRLRVRFAKAVGPGAAPAAGGKTEIEQVDCYDGVFIESRTANPDGTPATIDRIFARTLTHDHKSGDFAADGPGEVTSIRLGNAANPVGGGLGPSAQSQPAAAAAKPTINYLNVHFQRNAAGNYPRREMTFYNQVQSIYGPVDDWTKKIDIDHPDTWAQQTVLVNCDRMQVTGRPGAPGAGETYDLVAEGNALVEGTNFDARSPRLTYSQAKDLLIIEGDNRTDAVLYHQPRQDVERSATTAKRFMIWPSTKRVQIDGVNAVDLKPN
jgi:hypothetical protein